ncbi:MAG: response regulator, partial [Coriobacteriales bacterium]|nr:response regulator [Coriobacteriales bacterium]
MSTRIKIFLSFIAMATIILIFGIVIGFVFIQRSSEEAVESDMAVMASLADDLISSQINLLEADATIVAHRLGEADGANFHDVLENQVAAYDAFMALTVFDRNGMVDAAGIAPTPLDLLGETLVQRAFEGESLISTTYQDPSGELVFHLYAPMDERVLSVTISGMYFSDLLNEYKIWESGHIFIDDADGYVIANIRPEWVLERYNFIEMAKGDPQYQSIANTINHMIAGETGVGRFSVGGVERICSYRPVSGSLTGWSLGIVAPLAESPAQNTLGGLMLVGGVCLLLSVIASLIASFFIEKPYRKMNEAVTALERQTQLLQTTNETASLLLVSEVNGFEDTLAEGMEMLARCINADFIGIWENFERDGKLYYHRSYRWMRDEGLLKDTQDSIEEFCYGDLMPEWAAMICAGQTVSGPISTLGADVQEQLGPLGILSMLDIPLFVNGSFWGFVSIDDYHLEREFLEDEVNILRSGSLLIANAILRNKMSKNLIEAREEAVSNAVAKGDFLANMSHEMRTPLNAIIGLCEVMLDNSQAGGETRGNLEKVYDSGMTLLSLVNDILDISKIDSGKFELVPVEYDTASLINDTVTLNSVRIGSKPIEFRLDVQKTLPHRLFGDELRIRQICNNLLSNAFKYTREGFVEWQIASTGEGDNVWLILSVTDSGIGIRQNDIEKLFSDYNQVDTKSNRKVEGTGLGLAITKRLVEMMDGTITLESKYGKGSTFTVRIRQKFVTEIPLGEKLVEQLKDFGYSKHKRDRSAKLVRAHLPYAKVLVVDDVTTNLDVAKGMLKPYGMLVDCVTSGQEAIDLIREEKARYNAIFMDHMMPGMDGITATKAIHEGIGTEYAHNIPVIALTANAIVGNEEMFLNNGFQAFLSKPIDIFRLDAVVNQWVRDRVLEQNLLASQTTLTAPDEGGNARWCSYDIDILASWHIDGLDLEKGLRRFEGNEEAYCEVLESYACNTPPLLDQLRSYATGDLSRYAITVHGIKGSSRGIGAEQVGARAEMLEHAAKASDLATIEQESDSFIMEVRALLTGLTQMLQAARAAVTKPRKTEPSAEVLADLLHACEQFDVDGADRAMDELERFDYE